jgi:type III pantothenate kinase
VPTAGASATITERALRVFTRAGRVDGAVLCSVVPAATGAWRRAVKRVYAIEPLKVSHKLDLGIGISYPEPARIGADRLANACAATALYGVPVIAMDFGTALTFDVVSARREYVGGVIAPGLSLMTDYLAEKTALLPRTSPRLSRRVIGKSTAEAMSIGASIGYRGLVREILGRLVSEVGRNVKLCATGGCAKVVLKGLGGRIRLDPDLTLRGLGITWELNRASSLSDFPPEAGLPPARTSSKLLERERLR